jgi:hypothetical protein
MNPISGPQLIRIIQQGLHLCPAVYGEVKDVVLACNP